MAVTLNKANLVLKDANGNIGKVEQLSDHDLAKIKTAVSDVALVVNQSNHTPIEATTTSKGVVQLATSADVAAGATDKVVTAEQLHNSTTGTSGLATENLARIDAVVTEAGIAIDHTDTNQLKTAVTTLVNNATPATATASSVGVVKPDNNTITVDRNGTLTATVRIPDVYVKKSGDVMSGPLSFSSAGVCKLDNNKHELSLIGGSEVGQGARLVLHSKDRTDDAAGSFIMQASDGNSEPYLSGNPSGLLRWNGKNLVRSVNGVNADGAGNVSITTVANATHATKADSATYATNASSVAVNYNGQINSSFSQSNQSITVSVCGYGRLIAEIPYGGASSVTVYINNVSVLTVNKPGSSDATATATTYVIVAPGDKITVIGPSSGFKVTLSYFPFKR